MIARRLICRLRGHDDAVLEVSRGSALLWCARCGRRQLAPSLVALPSIVDQARAVGVDLVDRDALALLRAAAVVEAAYAERAARQLDEGGEGP